MLLPLDTKITDYRKIDKKRLQALKKMGLETIRDLIFYYPKRYEDFSTITFIKDLQPDYSYTIRGQIKSIEADITPRKRMKITKAIVSDDTATIQAIWFNQYYLKKYLTIGSYVTLNGKVEKGYPVGFQMTSPAYEKYKKDSIHTGRIIPVYSESRYLTSRWLRFIIKPLLKKYEKIADWLPHDIIKKHNLLDINKALHNIHFPENIGLLEQAKYRLAFDEMFLLQLNALRNKADWQQNKCYPIIFEEELIKEFVDKLPFSLTKAQKISAWEILKDLSRNQPMNRLLQGDVGSGKTIVAAIAILQTNQAGYQAALMAPTEILAAQHFNSLNNILKNYKINIALLTRSHISSNTSKNISQAELIKSIKEKRIDLIIGTHALIQEKVKFKNLALAIIDEQHRFGVKQREKLKTIDSKKNQSPHLLSMTATPIPRTLTLSLFGDLDISIIDELPPGRKKIITKLVAPDNRAKAYQFIRDNISRGRQAFVVCPLIEESDKLGVKSAKQEYHKLNNEVFPNLKIGILHGRLEKEEKEKVMQDYIANKINILVSTAVIEVGVDIPNATIMIIEGAERFGLSQLHQFRGRVGRSRHQSYCLLFTDSDSEKTQQRLNAMTEINDGFKLAEIDLEMRGAGEIYGLKQSGLPDLRMASLTDTQLIKLVRSDSMTLIKKDFSLKKYPALKNKLSFYAKSIHFE